MRIRSFPAPLLAGLVAATLAIAACSGSSSTPTPSSPAASSAAPSTAASEAPSGSPAGSGAAGTTVMTAQSPLGTILVDGQGRTLYMYMNDKDGKPSCYDTCAANWPALTVTGAVTVGGGLDASKFTTVDRTDGSKQVVVGGEYPLYYFAKDSKPGDTNGQNIGPGKWFVVSDEGEPIKNS